MKPLVRAALLALVAFLVAVIPAVARPVTAEDLYRFVFLSSANISPDGRHVAVISTRVDGPKNAGNSTILLVDVATGRTFDATKGKHDGDIGWMPNSAGFAFVRPDKKTHKPQIFTYDLTGGKIAQLTHLKDGAAGPVYSFDGKRIAFTVNQTDPAHAAWVDFKKAGFTPPKGQRTSDIRVITDMHYEANGAGFVYDQHAHIWVMNSDGSHPVALTSGHWSENGPLWSPDDSTIAFQSLRYDSPSLGPSDIYTIPSRGGAMTKLATNEVANGLAGYGNRGNRLWYFSGGVYDPDEFPALASADADGSAARVLIAKNTLQAGDSLLADMKEGGGGCGPLFTADDASFVMNVDGPGYANLRRIDAKTGTVRDLTPPRGEAWSCTSSADGRTIAYLYSDFTHPADVYVVHTDGGAPRRLTGVNDALLVQLTLSVPQPLSVKDSAGFPIQAWFMPATGGTPGVQKRPTLLDIHGGPATEFGDTFFHEFQYWTSLGYNVVFSDPRGSTGHGYPLQEALAKNFGNAMFEDVQAVMDDAVQRPDVDASRLGVLGGSYGGYATLWVIAHTNRYRAAVAERVVSNLATEQLAADLASDNALGGKTSWGIPWQSNSQYAAQSPITYVENVRTPLLILHSELDTRTPIDQTLQEFTALKWLGRQVEFVDVPGETHDLSRTGSPLHRVQRLNIIADWLNRFLRP
jgi:dipeptidyl aminopeptidase/acylaminoacyl peptidase